MTKRKPANVFIGELAGGGFSAEQYADQIMLQMFDLRDVPKNYREQLIAFQHEAKAILVHHIKEAMLSERLRIGAAAQSTGLDILATAMRRQTLETMTQMKQES